MSEPFNDFITPWNEKDIESGIKMLSQSLHRMNEQNARILQEMANLRDEKWKDAELQKMKEEMERAKSEANYGFPMTKKQNEDAYNWRLQHDEVIHGNVRHYHGASGGGYHYVFYPTGLGTAGDIICSTCQTKAIKEAGADWYDYCKNNLHGIHEFAQLD